jgi:hypothetical protein
MPLAAVHLHHCVFLVLVVKAASISNSNHEAMVTMRLTFQLFADSVSKRARASVGGVSGTAFFDGSDTSLHLN